MGSLKNPLEASNADEYLLQHTLLFAESLKDLRSTRAQMYSAAEHFELSYKNNQQQELVEEEVKDYITKALISTVDHLGSVAYKVDSFLDAKVDEISSVRLQFSGIEQRLRAHQQFVNISGLSRQSVPPDTAKHYKCYSSPGFKHNDKTTLLLIPSGATLSPLDNLQMQRLNQDDSIVKSFQVPGSKSNAPLQRKGHAKPHSAAASPKSPSFSFMRAASIKEIGKRAISPLRFPLHRSGSVANRSISPTPVSTKQRYPSEPGRPNSNVFTKLETKKKETDIEVYSKKSKHLFRALISVHKSRKQGVTNGFNG